MIRRLHRGHERRPASRTSARVIAALLFFAFFALAGAALAQRSIDPSGLIAAVAPDGALVLVDPSDGSLVTRIDGVGRAQFPAWSSDGNRVAVIVAEGRGSRVDVVDVAAGALRAVLYRRPGRAPIYLSWAPGDRTIAVLASAPGGTLALDLVDVGRALAGDAEGVRPFARGAPFYWTWSRTGRSLLVHQNVLGPGRTVGVTDIDAFEVRRPVPDPGAFQAPAFSTSERYLAYAALAPDGVRRVRVLAHPEVPAGARVERELPHLGSAALAWRPHAEQLAVQSAPVPESPHPFGPVDLLDVGTGAVTRLSDDTVVASWWSPDGRWLATLSPLFGGGGNERQADGVGAAVQVAVAQVQRGSGLWALKVVDADTLETRTLGLLVPSPLFVAQYLPFFDQYARSHRLWSSASDALVLPALDDAGVATLVVFRLDGSTTPLVPGDMPAWNVR
jgi:TolB protein